MNIKNEEQSLMKYLKIENNKGHYLKTDIGSSEWIEIDKISKDDLLSLLNKAVSDEFEMDTYEEEKLGHKAHQIVYKSIYEKFEHLVDNKNTFKDECDGQFIDAINKYESEEE